MSTLIGTVSDANGNPIAGATVYLAYPGMPATYTAATNSQGQYEISYLAGQYMGVYADRTGYTRGDWIIFQPSASGVDEVNITLALSGEEPSTQGTLEVHTLPEGQEVFVGGQSWGNAPQSRAINIGTHTISFGDCEGYTTPANITTTITANQESLVVGTYVLEEQEEPPLGKGTLTIDATPIQAEVYVNGISWGLTPQSQEVDPGSYSVAFIDYVGYNSPQSAVVVVVEGEEATLLGVYQAVADGGDGGNGGAPSPPQQDTIGTALSGMVMIMVISMMTGVIGGMAG